ncbi:MAG: ABC transporter permease [Brevinema sp.]
MNNIIFFIFKRILNMIPVLVIISIVLFMITRAMPGDPVDVYLGVGGDVTAERREEVRRLLGLDQPLTIQYFQWAVRMLRGDFGDSFVYRRPVKEIIVPFIQNSFILNIGGFIIAFLISIPVGIISAVRKGQRFDRFWTIFSLIGFCIPSFFTAIVVIFIFAIKIPLFPISGMSTPGIQFDRVGYLFNVLQHMVLPLMVVVFGSTASLTRYMRNAMLEVLSQDYIRTARAKGLKGALVIYKHAFRNALIPIVILTGLYLPGLFGGAVILETIFVWPGIGRELYTAVIGRDYNLVMTLNMFFALLTLLGSLIADVGNALVDPRVRL